MNFSSITISFVVNKEINKIMSFRELMNEDIIIDKFSINGYSINCYSSKPNELIDFNNGNIYFNDFSSAKFLIQKYSNFP